MRHRDSISNKESLTLDAPRSMTLLPIAKWFVVTCLKPRTYSEKSVDPSI